MRSKNRPIESSEHVKVNERSSFTIERVSFKNKVVKLCVKIHPTKWKTIFYPPKQAEHF